MFIFLAKVNNGSRKALPHINPLQESVLLLPLKEK
jgi:hypothetical protein